MPAPFNLENSLIITPGLQGPPGPVGPSVQDSSALSSLNASTFQQGSLAVVRDRLTLWSYNPSDTSSPDGWHIPANPAGNWVYFGPAAGATFASNPDIYIDPAAGSDDNAGTESDSPLLTYAEYVRRCGGSSPPLDGDLHAVYTIHILSSQTPGADPVYWSPFLLNGATAIIKGEASLVASGTLSGVSAMTIGNLGSGHCLRATLPAGAAAGLLLINSTRGNARAMVQSSAGGNSWNIDRPYQPLNIGVDTLHFTPVDTFANGDSVQLYALPSINLVTFEPQVVSYNGAFSTAGYVYQAVIQPALVVIAIRAITIFVDCWNNAFINSDQSIYVNVVINSETISHVPVVWGGGVGAAAIHTVHGESIVDTAVNYGCLVEGTLSLEESTVGSVCVTGIVAVRSASIVPSGVEPMQFYGSGTVDATACSVIAISTASTSGADTFKQSTLHINGLSTASAFDSGSDPAVWHANRNLATGSGAGQNIDVAIAGGGFGGRAICVGGASIIKVAT